MANYANIPPKRKLPKVYVDYVKKYAEQRAILLDIIESEVTIGQALLQIKSGFGDGIFNRRIAELKQLFTHIHYNSHTKLFTDTSVKIDKPLTESEVEKSV